MHLDKEYTGKNKRIGPSNLVAKMSDEARAALRSILQEEIMPKLFNVVKTARRYNSNASDNNSKLSQR